MEQIHIKAWDEFTKDEIYKLVPIMVEKYSSILDIIHGKGIVHGDITQENIVIDYNEKFWILDFGIASYSTKCTGYNVFYSDRIPHYHLLGSKKTKDGWTDKWMLGRAILKIISNVVPELRQTEAYHFICTKNVTSLKDFTASYMIGGKILLMLDDNVVRTAVESLLFLDPTKYETITSNNLQSRDSISNHVDPIKFGTLFTTPILTEALAVIDKLDENNIKSLMKFVVADIVRTYLGSSMYYIYDDYYVMCAVVGVASSLLFGSNRYRNFGFNNIINIDYDKLHNTKINIMREMSFRPLSSHTKSLLMMGSLNIDFNVKLI